MLIAGVGSAEVSRGEPIGRLKGRGGGADRGANEGADSGADPGAERGAEGPIGPSGRYFNISSIYDFFCIYVIIFCICFGVFCYVCGIVFSI